MVHLHNGILLCCKKEGNLTLCNSMNGSGEHYPKWNKPGRETEVPGVAELMNYQALSRLKMWREKKDHVIPMPDISGDAMCSIR